MDAITPRLRFDWTEDKVTDARRLWGESFSATDIARILGPGLSRNSVIGKLHRLGLTRGDQAKAPQGGRLHDRARPVRRNRNRVIDESFRGANRTTIAKRALRARVLAGDDDIAIEGDNLRDLPPDQSPHAVSLLDATEDQCRYPLNDPGPGFLFCGAPTVTQGRSWCHRHAGVVFGAGTYSERAATNRASLTE